MNEYLCDLRCLVSAENMSEAIHKLDYIREVVMSDDNVEEHDLIRVLLKVDNFYDS